MRKVGKITGNEKFQFGQQMYSATAFRAYYRINSMEQGLP
jgi:hypothetical protein